MITPTNGVAVGGLLTVTTLMDYGFMHTRLTEMLGIEHPVMLAGMGGVSYHRLVAAVSEAGGFGTLGAAAMSSEQMEEEIRGVRELTDKPFGVDLLAALPQRMIDDAKKVVAGGAALFVAGLGVPRDVIDVLHEGSVLVASMCGKVRHAIAAVEAGCDFVIAQGTEAGGHTGTVATMPLVPQIVDAVGDRTPVVAAGGIFDGRGLAAALSLGADGVWLGTRFIATPEARVVDGYKEALLEAHEDDTVISRGFTGKTLRAIRNDWTQYIEEHPEELRPFPEQMGRAVAANALHLGGDTSTPVDPNKECYPSGQGVGAIDALIPAGELVRRIVDEAEHALARAAATVVR
jgi:enoyl-[acyl-carrier protein] reductase II